MGGGEYDYRRSGGATNVAEVESGESARDCRISLEQNRALMRILKLTAASEKKLFKAREKRDAEAERIAAEIVADIRKRGDKALFEWTKKLDGIDLRSEGLWIGEKEIAVAKRAADKGFLKAVQHATRNVRRVAQEQLPKPWSIETDR